MDWKIMKIENRIALLESRPKAENSNIVKKLRRKLAKLAG